MSNKSTKEIIQEIHNDFYSAEERLFVDAVGLTTQNPTMPDKAKRAQKLGFGSAKPVKEYNDFSVRKIQAESTIKTIEYYRQNYPSYKWISESGVKRLCEKYKLFLGAASSYIGDIPEKNLAEIENFKLLPEDMTEVRNRGNSMFDVLMMEHESMLWQAQQTRWNIFGLGGQKQPQYQMPEKKIKLEQQPFQICAPITDFQITSLTQIQDGYKLEEVYPDPIVLQPLRQGYLIVTAWGEEASDELVVNEKMN